MNQVIKIRYQLLSILLLSFSNVAIAVDFEFRPRLETGLLYYSFEQSDLSIVTSPIDDQGNPTILQDTFTLTDAKFSDTLPFIGAGITVFADRFFLDLSAQKAFNGSDNDINQQSSSFTEIQDGNDIFTLTTFTDRSFDIDFDRTEYALSLGYAVTDGLAVFAGYKKSKTDRDEKDPNRQVAAFLDGQSILQDVFSLEFETELEFDGPFLGAVYGWNIDKGAINGTLSANIAVGFFDGESSSRLISAVSVLTGEPLEDPDTVSTSLKGDTTGVTIGLNWTGLTPVERLTYQVGISGYDYTFDSDSANLADFDETAITLKLGVAYSF